jgi:2-polyprenyl-6-methoxyphenol hydroxylase-like FAD-dependent oxidoreductase
MTMHRPTVEIAGAGLAGLAGAVAFASRGWRVRVWEQGDRLREIGAGLYVWENGLRVLAALGVYNDLKHQAHPVRAFEVVDERQRVVEHFEYSQEPGHRLLTMLRPLLHGALAARAESLGVEIVTGMKVSGARPDGTLLFTDGSSVTADLVVGADGVHSRVRDSLDLASTNRVLRDGATRMLLSRTDQERGDPDAQKCVEYWSGTRRVLYTPCHGDWVYIAVVGRNDDDRARQVPVDVESWVQSFPHLEPLLRRITPSTEGRWDSFGMVHLKSWSHGRVAITGDAAHAQPPNLGQGACLAMSNMLALAVAAERSRDDIPAALAEWERLERPLVEHTQRWTYRWGLLSATCPRGLERIRSPFVSWAGHRPWIASRLARTASHIPTGTEYLEPSLTN